MSNRRDLLVLGGLLVALIAFTILGPGRQPETPAEQPTTHSSADGGALALLQWLDALGYDARRLEYTDYRIDPQVDALFVLAPSVALDETRADAILQWVEQGGTLIVAEDRPRVFQPSAALLSRLGFTTSAYGDLTTAPIERAPLVQPLPGLPLQDFSARTGSVLTATTSDYARLAGPPDGMVLAARSYGEGYVYLSSAVQPFTNGGLRDPSSGALVLNLLRAVPPGGTIQFDEYHHGYFEPPTPTGLLLASPWGWAGLYCALVVALYFILTGRRFGRPVPLREEETRRGSNEYVWSMADLLQRGGKRAFVLRHYHTALKRRLAKPSGLNPRMDDDEFVAELARVASIDPAALRDLLARLRRDQVSEAELLATVAAALSFPPGEGHR